MQPNSSAANTLSLGWLWSVNVMSANINKKAALRIMQPHFNPKTRITFPSIDTYC
jgi:hypothetical protein